MKKTALVIGVAPYGGRAARDALDLIMASASFDVVASVFFVDDGVFQLVKTQEAEYIEQKNVSSLLRSLPLFDVSDIHACNESVQDRGLTEADMIMPVKWFDHNELALLLRPYELVFYF